MFGKNKNNILSFAYNIDFSNNSVFMCLTIVGVQKVHT